MAKELEPSLSVVARPLQGQRRRPGDNRTFTPTTLSLADHPGVGRQPAAFAQIPGERLEHVGHSERGIDEHKVVRRGGSATRADPGQGVGAHHGGPVGQPQHGQLPPQVTDHPGVDLEQGDFVCSPGQRFE